jgi:hypothetical protein
VNLSLAATRRIAAASVLALEIAARQRQRGKDNPPVTNEVNVEELIEKLGSTLPLTEAARRKLGFALLSFKEGQAQDVAEVDGDQPAKIDRLVESLDRLSEFYLYRAVSHDAVPALEEMTKRETTVLYEVLDEAARMITALKEATSELAFVESLLNTSVTSELDFEELVARLRDLADRLAGGQTIGGTPWAVTTSVKLHHAASVIASIKRQPDKHGVAPVEESDRLAVDLGYPPANAASDLNRALKAVDALAATSDPKDERSVGYDQALRDAAAAIRKLAAPK